MNKRQQNKIIRLNNCREYAISRGGVCLSNEYIKADSNLSWICEKLHEWDSSYSNTVSAKHWCKKCYTEQQRLGIEVARDIAIEHRGTCLTNEYISNKQKLRWRCEKLHEWDAILKEVRGGTWCPHCRDDIKFGLDDCNQWAIEKGGECVSDEYLGFRVNISWRCKFNHEWETTPHRIRAGSWCHECGKHTNVIDGLSIGKRIAAERSGELLSTKYINNKLDLRWRCDKGHEWCAPLDRVSSRRSWCPHCRYKNEAYCRKVFEHLFGRTFDKIRPDWLKNPITGCNLELDGYCEYESVAFEYNGIQHYKYHSGWHDNRDDVDKQIAKDAIKDITCRESDVLLIVIPYTYNCKIKIDQFIISELNSHGYDFSIEDLYNVDYYI